METKMVYTEIKQYNGIEQKRFEQKLRLLIF